VGRRYNVFTLAVAPPHLAVLADSDVPCGNSLDAPVFPVDNLGGSETGEYLNAELR